MKAHITSLLLLIAIISLKAQTASPRAIPASPERPGSKQVIHPHLKNISGASTLRNTSNAISLNYAGIDNANATANGGNLYYETSDGINAYYPNSANFTFQFAAVIFDSIETVINAPYPTFKSYPLSLSTLSLDSLDIYFVHEDNMAATDTIKVTVFDLSSASITGTGPSAKLSTDDIWDTMIIVNTTLPLNYDYTGDGIPDFTDLTFYPGLQFAQGKTFGARVDFYGDTASHFNLINSFTNLCGGSCQAMPTTAGFNSLYYENYTYGSTNISLLCASDGGGFFLDCNSNGNYDPQDCEASNIQNWFIWPSVTVNCPYDASIIADSLVSCNNSQINLAANVVGSNAAPFIYNWAVTSGDGTLSANNDSVVVFTAGRLTSVVSLTVTDGNDVIITTSTTVASYAINLTITNVTMPTCPGNNGAITANAQDDLAACVYFWNTGANSKSLSNLSAGIYSLTVNNTYGCSATLTDTLLSNSGDELSVLLTATNTSCDTGGSIVAVPANGIAPFSYLWSDGETGAAISNLMPGTYTVTVTDSAACQTKGNAIVNGGCISHITGLVFTDANNNCIFDSLDARYPFIGVIATNSNGENYYGTTNAIGVYDIIVYDSGTYNLSTFTSGSYCTNVSLCNADSLNQVHIVATGDSANNNNLAIGPHSSYDLTMHPGWTSADPGFQKEYWIAPFNQSNTPFTGQATVTFVYDSNLVYQSSADPQPTVDMVAHTLTWVLDSLPYPTYDWDNFRLDNIFMVPSSLSLSYLLQSDFTITPYAGDCDTTNNHFHFSENVLGSHDPNEKDVQPAGDITANDSVLTYTIHFQNTGTDSTHFVTVTDTLSPWLDPATVRNMAASYKYSNFNISGSGILTWTFNPYLLPDSLTNASGSKGFITFSVKQKQNVPVGTAITNTASIYFDYNAPVVTNTLSSKVDTVTGIVNIADNVRIQVRVFPNPFNTTTNIIVTGLQEKYDFELYDVTGRLQRKIISIGTNQFELQRNDIAAGVYLYRIMVASQPLAYGKLVVE